MNLWLGPLERDVFIGRRVGEAGNQAEPGLADARADAVEEGELPDRRIDRALVNELLHPVQDRLALRTIELARLLPVERIHVRIAAVSKHAALDHLRLEPGGGVAEGAGRGLDDVLERLFRVALEEGRALEDRKSVV